MPFLINLKGKTAPEVSFFFIGIFNNQGENRNKCRKAIYNFLQCVGWHRNFTVEYQISLCFMSPSFEIRFQFQFLKTIFEGAPFRYAAIITF